MLDDDDAARLMEIELQQLSARKRELEQEREMILAFRANWEASQDKLDEIEHWCRMVGKNVRGLTYSEKRLALEALSVRVRLYRTDHEPRYEITASIPLDGDVKRILPTTQQRSVSGTPRGHRQAFDQESGGDTPFG